MKELNEMKLREINGGVIGIDDFFMHVLLVQF